jgi:hypothetical protein
MKTDNGSAFVLNGEYINRIQTESIRELVRKAKATSVVDVVLIYRVNGKEERYEADWIKYLEEVQ